MRKVQAMKLYTWWDAGEDEQAFFSASLASARKALKEHLREETMFSIPIERIDVGSLSRELLLRVLNGEGYVNEKTTVETWQAFAC